MAKANRAVQEQEEEVVGPQVEGTEGDDMESILEYSIDLNDQEKPPILPIGDYLAEITGIEKKYGKDSGRPYLNVKWSISTDNQPADFVESLGTGQSVSLFSMVFGCEDNPVSRYNMKLFCKAIGQPMSNRMNPKEFLGRAAKITVKHGKDLANQPRPEVGAVKAA